MTSVNLVELLSSALSAEETFQDAEQEGKHYSGIASERKQNAREAWNALHALLGALHKQHKGHWSGYGESKLAKLLSFWDEMQVSERRDKPFKKTPQDNRLSRIAQMIDQAYSVQSLDTQDFLDGITSIIDEGQPDE